MAIHHFLRISVESRRPLGIIGIVGAVRVAPGRAKSADLKQGKVESSRTPTERDPV